MRRLLAGVPLLALSLPAGATHAGSVSPAPGIQVTRLPASGPYAGCRVRGPGQSFARAQSQPQTAVDPRTANRRRPTLLAVWAQDPWSNGGARGLVTALSTDGGRRWRARTVPWGSCAGRNSRIARVSFPSMAIGPDGTAYLAAGGMSAASLATDGSANFLASFDTLLVATSRNHGATWTNRQALPFNAGNVSKGSIATDSRRRGTAYVVWDSELGSWFSRTVNGGKSWSKAARIVPGQPTLPVSAGNVIVVNPRTGAVSVIYVLLRPLEKPRRYCNRRGCHPYSSPGGAPPYGADLMIISSSSGGRTWSRPRLIARVFGLGQVGPRVSGWTWLALNRPAAAVNPKTGQISVVWQDSRFSLGRFDEVALSVSDRAGRRWSRPVPVDAGNNPAVVPSVAVNSHGVTGVAYYQLRAVPAGAQVPPADYWFRAAVSPTRLASPRRLAGPLDLGRTGQVFAPFMAHFEGMTATGSTFRVAFVVPARVKRQTNVVVATVH